MQHPIFDPLRVALHERLATQTVGTTARICLVERRKLQALLQGQTPDFSAEELERLAFYLELRLASTRGSQRFRDPQPVESWGSPLAIYSPGTEGVADECESSSL